jgi:hypothetical protein
VNGNHRIDGGEELFGTSTVLPNGSRAPNGFEALRVHDQNGDGRVTPSDGVWGILRLWADRDHDGAASHDEDFALGAAGVVAINLVYESLGPAQEFGADENGNHHPYRGTFIRRVEGVERTLAIEDVFFHRQ